MFFSGDLHSDHPKEKFKQTKMSNQNKIFIR
jgi:hypothetical protein